ncbi:MAG TPA: tail fiber domain-containing protein [Bryobacteraceae bacterium]|nr:tail fiber domain-containing protein [Bryobacteraceae bacterium]
MRGVTTGANNAVPVVIDANGQLGTVSSSRRYKEDIRDMGDASNGLMQLRPVTFRYKRAYEDGSKPIQYGLIAEEVAQAFPDLVAQDKNGHVETIKYQLLDPMLLNELQKQHATVAAQREQIRRQEEQIRSLDERLARVEAALGTGTATTAARQRLSASTRR